LKDFYLFVALVITIIDTFAEMILLNLTVHNQRHE